MKTERVHWIDVARGIGIILVLYGHAINAESYRHLIYAFHMPLFFFLSGITFYVKDHENFWQIFKKAVRNILFPYFLFSIISYALWYLDVRDNATLAELQKQFISIFYGNSNNNGLIFNNILWFLPCLFVTRMLFATITRISTNQRFLLAILFFISIEAYLFSLYFPNSKLFFSAEAAITGVVFFGLGFLWYQYAEKINMYLKKYALSLIPSLFVVCITCATINYNMSGHQIDIRLNRLDNYFLFYISALSGILGTITVSLVIGKNRFMEYIGRHSLILFGWHLILFGYFAEHIRWFISAETIKSIRNTYLAPLYTALSIIVILLTSRLIKSVRIITAKVA